MSLSLKGREIGHRTLRRFYRQSFKAHSTSLGAAKPELQALMEQYATAGVLSAHTPSLAAGAHKRNEVSKMQNYKNAKLFVKTGESNNMTLTKHYKNQSLNF